MMFSRRSPISLRGNLALAATLASGAVWAQSGAVHEHGVAHLDLAVQGQSLELQIRSPGMDLLGFEHEPRTVAEREAVARLRRALVENKGLVVPTPAALCTLVSAVEGQDEHDDDHDHDDDHRHGHDHEAKGEHKHDQDRQAKSTHSHGHQHDHGKTAGAAKAGDHAKGHDHAKAHDHDKDHDHADEHGHGDWVVNYRYECRQPAELRGVSLGWFQAFPGAAEIRFQAATPAGQAGGTLTPQQAEIRW